MKLQKGRLLIAPQNNISLWRMGRTNVAKVVLCQVKPSQNLMTCPQYLYQVLS